MSCWDHTLMFLGSSSNPSFLFTKNSWTSLRWSPWSWITSPISASLTIVPLQAERPKDQRIHPGNSHIVSPVRWCWTYRISSWLPWEFSFGQIFLGDLGQWSRSCDHFALYPTVSDSLYCLRMSWQNERTLDTNMYVVLRRFRLPDIFVGFGERVC